MSNNKYTMHGKADYSYKAQEHIKVANQIISKVIAEEHKAHPSTKQLKRAPLPFKEDGDMVTVKIHSKFKPTIWNKNQNRLSPDTQVWKNSTLWVSYEPRGYNKSIGIGCTLYISGIQIDTLVEGSSLNSECPFPNREEKQGATA